jgi:sulfide:quinone oxidoreductase
MDCNAITPEVSVTGQFGPSDIALVHALGFRSVLCNRPDGEADEQPLFETIQNAAEISGIVAHYIPVTDAGPEPRQIDEVARLWPSLPKPVLAYSGSGARSTALINAVLANL